MTGRGALAFGLALLATGCGDGLPVADALATPDADRGLISVQLRSDLATPGGQLVLFQAADASLVLSTRTDDDGRANALAPPETTVTVVTRRGGSTVIYSQLGVNPGDQVVIDERLGITRATTVDVRVPVDPDATFYNLYTSCGSRDIRGAELAPVTVQLANCEATASMLVFTAGIESHYLYRARVPIEDGAVLDFTGPYHAFEPSMVVAVNTPSAVTELVVTQVLVGEGREVFPPGGTSSTISVSGSTGATTLQLPRPAEGVTLTEVQPVTGLSTSVSHRAQWAPSTETTTVDLAATQLRPYLTRPSYAAAGNAVRWTEPETGGAEADAVYLAMAWSDALGRAYNWTVLSPRAREPSVELPVLPVADLAPASDAFVFELTNIAIEGGYPRLGRLGVLGRWRPGRTWPTDGDAGWAVHVDLGLGDG